MITLTKDVVYDRGRAVVVPGVQIEDKRLVVEGRFLTLSIEPEISMTKAKNVIFL